VTTIFRFADAGLLNDRPNIVVMVDEAHRTQEGRLGADLREALPNAKFIGLTGTPISTNDRNTWGTFGDPSDPGGVLNHYSVERSIADGSTLPIHAETRLVDFHIDKEALDQRGDRKPGFDHTAAPWYSWMSPPRRSRRRTSRGLTGIGSRASASGGARARARWGRPRL